MYVSDDGIRGAIANGRCACTNVKLLDGEFLISAKKFPQFYLGQVDKKEIALIHAVVDGAYRVLLKSDVNSDEQEALRSFFGFFILKKCQVTEAHVHRYLHLFWDISWEDASEKLHINELYSEAAIGDSKTDFAGSVVSSFPKRECWPDLLGLGGAFNREMFVIEVKLDGIDDRAIGQILRYYSTARLICDQIHHGCDIRKITPVLISEKIATSTWLTLPLHFRELLRVYRYRVDPINNRLLLKDMRKALDSNVRESNGPYRY